MPEAATARPSATAADACLLCARGGRRLLFTKRGWRFVRCDGCGLVSLDPLPTPAAVAAHHEASYARGAYAAFAAADDVRATIARHRLARLRPAAAPGPWLDVGCSTGAFVAAAAGAGLDAEGLELSPTAVRQARARGLVVHEGAVEAFTPTRRYGVVTAFDVVEHLLDPPAFVGRVAGWLAPGGLLALTLPDIASPTARLLGRTWFYWAPPDHVHYFTPATATRLVAEAGFDQVTVRPARKPLTIAYAVGAVGALVPGLHPLGRTLAALVPRGLRVRPIPLPLGEMLVTARARGR
jgi:SAM-dependent methyltransferase